MSAYYAKHGKPEVKKYTKHGKTVQSQKDECDINKLIERSARAGTLSHLDKYESQYGDYTGYNFERHMNTIAEGNTIFENLPAEIKREFDQSAQKFFNYVTKPENSNRLAELLPAIARNDDYFGVSIPTALTEPTEPAESPPAEPTPDAEPAPSPEQ